MTINKNTFVCAPIEIKDVIDAMTEEQYVLDDDEKLKLVCLMFNNKGLCTKSELLANAVEFITLNF